MPEIIQKAMATIEAADTDSSPYGGFTAVLSTPSQDRDGDRLLRDEWQEPLPEKITIDIDHSMSVDGTVGSARPYFDDAGRLMIDATFASTDKAQEVRSLIREGHIGTVSVAFMTDRSKKDGTPRRELLNAGIVAIPANRDAVILSAKEYAALKAGNTAEPTAPIDAKSLAEAITKAAGGNDAEANLIQVIHDAATLLGSDCAPDGDAASDDGAADGANKSTDPETVEVTPVLSGHISVGGQVMTFEEFGRKLAALTAETKTSGADAGPPNKGDESPTEIPPADAASDKEPADAAVEKVADESNEEANKGLSAGERALAILSLF